MLHSEPPKAFWLWVLEKFALSLILNGVASPPLHAIFSFSMSLLRLLCFPCDLLDVYIFVKAERITAKCIILFSGLYPHS